MVLYELSFKSVFHSTDIPGAPCCTKQAFILGTAFSAESKIDQTPSWGVYVLME